MSLVLASLNLVNSRPLSILVPNHPRFHLTLVPRQYWSPVKTRLQSIPVPSQYPSPVSTRPQSIPVPSQYTSPVNTRPQSIPVPSQYPSPVNTRPQSILVPSQYPSPVNTRPQSSSFLNRNYLSSAIIFVPKPTCPPSKSSKEIPVSRQPRLQIAPINSAPN